MIVNIRTKIWVTFQKEGIHCYPEAATNPKLATGDQFDVSFLAHPHRHMFHFKVTIAVTHLNRDIEFIQFKRWLVSVIPDNLENMSCEMIAARVITLITNEYGSDRFSFIEVEVSEDGENGAVQTQEAI